MGDFSKSVNKDEPSSHGWIGVPPIQKDKKGKEPTQDISQKGQLILFNALFQYMKKIVNTLSERKKDSNPSNFDHQQTIEDLVSLRKMLQILGNEDQSHNAEFTQQLSEVWNNLIDDYKLLEITSKKNPILLSKLHQFIDHIEHFPSVEEHSLGYYLSHHVGNEWLPFPCMEILTKLHQTYLEEAESSQIASWIRKIDDILSVSGFEQSNIDT